MADLGEQVRLNSEINQLINERSVLLETQLTLMGQQIDLQRNLMESMQGAISGEQTANVTALSSSMTLATASAAALGAGLSNLGTTSNSTAAAQQQLSKNMAKGAKAATIAAGTFKVLNGILSGTKTLIKSVFQMATSVVGALFNIGKSLLALPLDFQKALIATANSVVDISPIALALEEVRKQFGDLQVSTGAIIKNSIGPMRAEFNQLAASGHSFAKTFGMGREGVAAAIKFNAELMGAMKGGSYELRQEIGANIAEHAIYRKSLGMTAEQQAALINKARQQGKSSTALQQDMAKFALTMGKRFGFSAKEMGSAMAEMSADVANFGTLSTRQYAQIAVYTKRLGIETKQLQGIINKYDNFEDAAKSASMLNQTFGMQVDVLKMLREEDPAARLRQLQDSFQATGRSYDKLSRVERKRLADLSGLDAAAAAAAFSQNGLSMSYDDIVAAGGDTEDSTKSLDNTMKELSKNMEKMLQLGRTFASFFEAFSQGFAFGFFRLSPVLKLLKNVRASLSLTFHESKGLGQMFHNMFPGVEQLVKGLTAFYDPDKFRARFDKIKEILSKFMTAIQDPKKIREAFGVLWKEATSMIHGIFDPNNSENQDVAQGLDTFATTMGNIALVFADKVANIVTNTLVAFTDIISGKKSFTQAFKDAFGTDTSGIFEGLEERFGENFEILANTVEKLWPALKNALEVLLIKLGPWLRDALVTLAPYLAEGLNAAWEAFKALDSSAQIGIIAWLFGDNILKAGASITAVMLSAFSAFKMAKMSKEISKSLAKALSQGVGQGADDAAKLAAKKPGMFSKLLGKAATMPKGGKLGALALGAAATGVAIGHFSGDDEEAVPVANNQLNSTRRIIAPPSSANQVLAETVPAANNQNTPTEKNFIDTGGAVALGAGAATFGTKVAFDGGVKGISSKVAQETAEKAANKAAQKQIAKTATKLGTKMAAKAALATASTVPFLGIVTGAAMTAWEAYEMYSKEGPITATDWAKLGLAAGSMIPGYGTASTVGYMAVAGAEALYDSNEAGKEAAKDMTQMVASQEGQTQQVKEAAAEHMTLAQQSNLLIAQAEEYATLNKRIQEAKSKIPNDREIDALATQLQSFVEQMNKATLEIYIELRQLFVPTDVIGGVTAVTNLTDSIGRAAQSFQSLKNMPYLNAQLVGMQLEGFRKTLRIFHQMLQGPVPKDIGTGPSGHAIMPITEWSEKITKIDDGVIRSANVKMGAIVGFIKIINDNLGTIRNFPANQGELTRQGFLNLIGGIQAFYSEIMRADGVQTWIKLMGTNLDPTQVHSGVSKINDYALSLMSLQSAFSQLSAKIFTIPELQTSLTDLQVAVAMIDALQAGFVNSFQEDGMGNVQSIVDNINKINTLVKTMMAADVKTIVDINNSLSGNKSMTIKHENLSLNLTVHVAMDAKEIVAGIMEVKRLPNKQNITWAPNLMNSQLG